MFFDVVFFTVFVISQRELFFEMAAKMLRPKCCYRFLFVTIIAMSMDMARTNPIETAEKSALDLIILHNNDMHARFEQTDRLSSQCHPDEVIANKCYGGFARVSQLLKEYRKKAEQGGPNVLYLNAGDTYTGTPWFTIYKDKIVSEFMNVLRPDAIVSLKFLRNNAEIIQMIRSVGTTNI